MTAIVVLLLTVLFVAATTHFFDWTRKYGDEWNWAAIKEGYKKGWPKLLAVTVLILAATAIVWYVLPEPKSAFGAFAKTWGVWVPMWGVVGGFTILRSLYKIFRETRRAPKPWIAFVAFGVLFFVGSMMWYGYEIAQIINAIA